MVQSNVASALSSVEAPLVAQLLDPIELNQIDLEATVDKEEHMLKET